MHPQFYCTITPIHNKTHKWYGCNWAAASSRLPPGRRGKTSSRPNTPRSASRGRSVPTRRRGSTRCVTRWRPGTSSPSSRSTQRGSTSWSPSLWPTDTSVHKIFTCVRPSVVSVKRYPPGVWLLTHNKLLHSLCSSPSSMILYKLLVFSGGIWKHYANVFFLFQEQGETALHLAVRLVDRTSLHIVDFLTQNR